MKTTFIYLLRDPANPIKGYVGKSDSPSRRFRSHLSIKDISYRANWISAILSQGRKPELEILDEVPYEHWQQWEVAYIEYFREEGFTLVNCAPGGESGPGFSRDYHPNFGKKRSPETCAKIAASRMGKKHTLEARAQMSADRKGRKQSPASVEARIGPARGKKHKNNTSGFVGVHWHQRLQKFQAQFRTHGIRHYVGQFSKIEDAVFARALALENHLTSVANSRT